MIEEQYCSYEVSKLLNKKGFRIDTEKDYWKIGADGVMYFMCSIGAYTSDPDNKYAFYRPKDSYPCPTQQMTMRWLREIHHIHIIAEPCLSHEEKIEELDFTRWFWTILKEDGEYKPIRRIDEFPNYEDAIEAAIKWVLENLI